jgi:triphosphoribosyl-dephospho-CoA synthetase
MYHGYGTQDYMLVLRRGWGPWAIGRGASRYRYEYNVTMHLKMHQLTRFRRYCCSYSLTQLTIALTGALAEPWSGKAKSNWRKDSGNGIKLLLRGVAFPSGVVPWFPGRRRVQLSSLAQCQRPRNMSITCKLLGHTHARIVQCTLSRRVKSESSGEWCSP